MPVSDDGAELTNNMNHPSASASASPVASLTTDRASKSTGVRNPRSLVQNCTPVQPCVHGTARVPHRAHGHRASTTN